MKAKLGVRNLSECMDFWKHKEIDVCWRMSGKLTLKLLTFMIVI